MRPKTLILMFVALGCGFVAMFVAMSISAKPSDDTIELVVTKQMIPQGAIIGKAEDAFTTKPFNKASAPPNGIPAKELPNLKNKIVAHPLDEGHLVSMRDFQDGAGIIHKIKDGYQAYSVPIKKENIIAGFTMPGARVNITGSFQKGGKRVTQTFLQNVEVLAIDQAAEAPAGGGHQPSANPTMITLMLKPQDVTKVALVNSFGPLTFSLRKPVAQGVEEKQDDLQPIDDPTAPTTGVATTGDQPKAKFVKLPIAVKDILPGTKLENPADYLQVQEVPDSVPGVSDAVWNLEDLKGKEIQGLVTKGLPIRRAQIGEKAVAVGKSPTDSYRPVILGQGTIYGPLWTKVDGQWVAQVDDKTSNVPVTQPGSQPPPPGLPPSGPPVPGGSDGK